MARRPFYILILSFPEKIILRNSFIKNFRYEWEGFLFLVRNIRASRTLYPMQDSAFSNYQFAGLSTHQVGEMDALHKLVREGRGLSFWRKTYFKHCGEKVCSVVLSEDGRMVGFNFYYFRKFEVNEGIIHEAFLGISPQERGKGLATALQTYTINQMSRNNLRGISGNVLKANGASVKMLLRTGFILTDDPDDAANYQVFYPLTTL